ncbi:transcription factor JunD [Rhipicephalus sanguineus]|uniref:BZIP domain-containing protein n=1 Tax=Rhipicephalus sanguineus TaxID=34632 RepID=A0A9D4PBW9_RHISA|nr:transcription factor JunD [Rhipicephalus sanguineus]KAH7935077.1 hypothetical protein HPB52_003681 [Rhipicephalus sanguineus]
MNLDLDNAGRPEHSSEVGCSSSLLTTPDLDNLQLTSPELNELMMGFYALEMTPARTTPFSLIEQEEHYPSGYADWLPQLQLQQQEQTQELPQSVLQQYVTPSSNVSDSGALTSNTNFVVASSTKPSVTGDYVEDKTQVVPALGATPPGLDELLKGLYALESPLIPPTLFSLNEEEEQYPSGCADGLPQLQRQQQEQTEPMLQQHVTSGPNIADSGVSASYPSFVLPSVSPHSVTGDYVKDKTQTVPALDATSPLWYISSDEDSRGGDCAHPTTMHQAPQQQPRCEDFITLKRTAALDLDNARSHQHNSKQARKLQTVPRQVAEPPLSPIHMRDREKSKVRERRDGKRIARARCRQRQINCNSQLRVKVSALKMEIAMMEAIVKSLRYQLRLLGQQVMTHVMQCCQI